MEFTKDQLNKLFEFLMISNFIAGLVSLGMVILDYTYYGLDKVTPLVGFGAGLGLGIGVCFYFIKKSYVLTLKEFPTYCDTATEHGTHKIKSISRKVSAL